MKYDAYTVAVVFATGAVAVSAVVVAGAVVYGLIGGAFWVAMNVEDWVQARNAAATKETP